MKLTTIAVSRRLLRHATAAVAYAQTLRTFPPPEQGTATQLIVEGKPFLALAGETGQQHRYPAWRICNHLAAAVAGNLNCVLAAVSWAQVEPRRQIRFTLVDGLIQEARRNRLKAGFLWFGS